MKNAIEIIFQSLFFFGVTLTVAAVIGLEIPWLPVLAVTVPVLTGLRWIREKSRNILLFFLIHLGILAVIIQALRTGASTQMLQMVETETRFGILSAGLPQVICLEILGLTCYSVLVRLKRELEAPSVIYIVITALLYFGTAVLDTAAAQTAGRLDYYAVFFMVLCILVYRNMEQAELFIANRGASTRMDTFQLKRISNGLTLVYVLIMAVLLAAVGRIPLDGATGWLGHQILRLLRWIISLFQGSEETVTQVVQETEAAMGGMPDLEISETSQFALILEKVIMAVFFVLMIAGAIAAIVAIAIAIYRRFYQNTGSTDEQEFISPFAKEAMDRDVKIRQKESFSERSCRRQLRRLYRRYAASLWRKQEEKLTCMTPAEQTKGEQEIAALYEKARYSSEAVTKEDVNRWKELVKNKGIIR